MEGLRVEQKKTPRIPPWQVWVLVITIVQAWAAIRNYRVHQQLWDAIAEREAFLIQSLEAQNQYNTTTNDLFNQILDNLEDH